MNHRVVFVNRYFRPDLSATSQILTDLAEALAARGVEVHVVCSRQLYDDPRAKLPHDEMLSGVGIHRVATTEFGRARLMGRAVDYASFYLSCAAKLLRLLRRGDVLVAKTDPPLLSIVAAPVAKAKGARLINWQQDVFPEVASLLGASPLPPLLDRVLKRLRDASLRAAAMNVLIGTQMRDYLVRRGIPECKLCVIENWADGGAIRPKPRTASRLREGLALGDRFIVCYSGNLGRAHEFDTVLGAALVLAGQSSPPVFLFIGSGAKMDELKEAVAERALENFRFLPYQPRDALEDSLAAADVHLVSLLPKLEGLIVPSKLYGILAAGRPVVFIGDAGGEIGRLIQRADCGRVIPVGDAERLATVLAHMRADPGSCAAMGDRARRIFGEEFSLERAIARWTAVIERCAS
jgi:glycosyltransferase involved in cell wall biosynthesis